MSNRCCGLCPWLPHLNVRLQAQVPRCEGTFIMSNQFAYMSDLRRTGDLKINWCDILFSSRMWWVVFFVFASLFFYHIFAAPTDSWHRCTAALSMPSWTRWTRCWRHSWFFQVSCQGIAPKIFAPTCMLRALRLPLCMPSQSLFGKSITLLFSKRSTLIVWRAPVHVNVLVFYFSSMYLGTCLPEQIHIDWHQRRQRCIQNGSG